MPSCNRRCTLTSVFTRNQVGVVQHVKCACAEHIEQPERTARDVVSLLRACDVSLQ